LLELVVTDTTIIQSSLQEYMQLQDRGKRSGFIGSRLPVDSEDCRQLLQLLVAVEKDPHLLESLFRRLDSLDTEIEVAGQQGAVDVGAETSAQAASGLNSGDTQNLGLHAPTPKKYPAVSSPGLEKLSDPSSSIRIGVLMEFSQGRRPTGLGWVEPLLIQAQAERSPAVLTQIAELIGGMEISGMIPLESWLQTQPVQAIRETASRLEPMLSHPVVLTRLLTGLIDPNRRAIAQLANEMATRFERAFLAALRKGLFLRVPVTQRACLATLLEISEDQAVAVLSEYPEELTARQAESQFQEVQSTFQLRRHLRRLNVPYFPMRCLGGGGMGEVYLSQDLKRPPRLGALKFLRPPSDGRPIDPALLSRFEREARVPLLLNHPGIVRVSDFGQAGDYHWIDVDYVQGDTLEDRLCREGALSLEESTRIIKDLAGVLDYLGRNRVVHRDLKPANVFLARDPDRVILGDFGLVQLLDEDMQEKVPNYAATSVALILGTVGYMSFEQATGGSVDQRSDLFSLGVIYYRMLSGRLPFTGDSLTHYVNALKRHTPPTLADRNVPLAIEEIIKRLLDDDVQGRYPDAGSFLIDLEKAVSRRAVDRPSDRVASPARAVPSKSPANADLVQASNRAPEGLAPTRPKTSIEVLARGPGLSTAVDVPRESAPLRTAVDAPSPQRAPLTMIEVPSSSPAAPVNRTLIQPAFVEKPSEFIPKGKGAKGVDRGEGRVVCKACGRWFDDRSALDWHQKSCDVMKAKAKKKATTGAEVGLRSDEEVNLKCGKCGGSYRSVIDGCIPCRLSLMPLTPWLVSWAILVCGLLLFALTMLVDVGGIDLPVRTPSGGAGFSAGLALLWIGWGMRRSQYWAYLAAQLCVAVLGIGCITLAGMIVYQPDLIVDLMLTRKEGRVLFALGFLILCIALAVSRRRSGDHFHSNWTTETIVSFFMAMILIAMSIAPI